MANTGQLNFVLSNQKNTPNGTIPGNALYITNGMYVLLDGGKKADPRYRYATLPASLIGNEKDNIDFSNLVASMGAWYEADWRITDKQSKKSLSITLGDARNILKSCVMGQFGPLSTLLQKKIKDELKQITGFEVDEITLRNGLDQVFFHEWLQDQTFVDRLNEPLQILGFQYTRETRMLSKIES